MRPVRRELLNGLFVLVLASLIHAAFEAFHLKFDVHLWALIVIGVAIAVSGYVVFEIALGFMVSTENRELAFMAATEDRERVATEATRKREEEWLKRVGTPARLELNVDEAGVGAAMTSVVEAVKAMRPGSDYAIMIYYGSEGGKESAISNEALENLFGTVLELLKRGAIREYKRIICFDHDVLENDQSLKSGVLRVGEGPGTISRLMGDHCRVMMKTKGCYLYVAPVVLRSFVGLYGVDKASITLEIVDQSPGGRRIASVMLFSDPPNGEIIEQLRQIERATERRMVGVHKICFPEELASTADRATR
jgi:hypothetical protein